MKSAPGEEISRGSNINIKQWSHVGSRDEVPTSFSRDVAASESSCERRSMAEGDYKSGQMLHSCLVLN